MRARSGIGLLTLGAGVIALGVVMMPTACTVLTNDALPDDAGLFEAGDADASTDSCNACVTQQCLGQRSVCVLDGTCSTIETCIRAGGSAETCACPSVSTTTDGGAPPFRAFVDDQLCTNVAFYASTACADACHTARAAAANPGDPHELPSELAACLPDAGDVDAGDVDGGDAAAPAVVTVEGCSSCISNSCADTKSACGTGTECARFLDCASTVDVSNSPGPGGCKDAACIAACGTSFPTGKESARELSSCVVTVCATACGL